MLLNLNLIRFSFKYLLITEVFIRTPCGWGSAAEFFRAKKLVILLSQAIPYPAKTFCLPLGGSQLQPGRPLAPSMSGVRWGVLSGMSFRSCLWGKKAKEKHVFITWTSLFSFPSANWLIKWIQRPSCWELQPHGPSVFSLSWPSKQETKGLILSGFMKGAVCHSQRLGLRQTPQSSHKAAHDPSLPAKPTTPQICTSPTPSHSQASLALRRHAHRVGEEL